MQTVMQQTLKTGSSPIFSMHFSGVSLWLLEYHTPHRPHFAPSLSVSDWLECILKLCWCLLLAWVKDGEGWCVCVCVETSLLHKGNIDIHCCSLLPVATTDYHWSVAPERLPRTACGPQAGKDSLLLCCSVAFTCSLNSLVRPGGRGGALWPPGYQLRCDDG